MQGVLARTTVGISLAGSLLALSACGSSKSSSSDGSASQPSSSLNLTISDSGKTAKYSGPSKISGGIVKISLHNTGRAPHGAQLIRVVAPHTVQEALKIIGGNSGKTPGWIRGAGGLGSIPPGQTAAGVVQLPAGNYAVTDVGGPSSSGPPAVMNLTVSGGSGGSLPSTPTTITAASTGKDKYAWKVAGALKAGANTVTFDSKGNDTIHLLSAVRITGHHSQAEILKALKSNGRPPSWVDVQTFTETAVLDSGKSQVTPLVLNKPGQYVLFCPLTDRDGGKPHFAEGLLKQVTVK